VPEGAWRKFRQTSPANTARAGGLKVLSAQEAGIDIELHIAGEDEAGGTSYRVVLERLISELGLHGKVKLLGAIAEDRVVSELEGAHVFALASLAEPLGVAIMEALAMKVPVVATNAGGVPELVTNGRSALLVEPERPRELAEAIRAVVTAPAKARSLSDNGHERIQEFMRSANSANVIASELLLCSQGVKNERWAVPTAP
jgi:glycosyltransferase involved in cell wall biosynthesis